MKKSFFGIFALVAAAVVAFAFKAPTAEAARATRSFQLTVPGSPFAPSSWEEVFLTPVQIEAACPSSSKVCIITVPETDVYTSGVNENLPKVDLQTGSVDLQDDINTALGNTSDPTTFVNGRIIYEKN